MPEVFASKHRRSRRRSDDPAHRSNPAPRQARAGGRGDQPAEPFVLVGVLGKADLQRTVDLMLLFAEGMDLNRNLDRYAAKEQSRLDRFIGTAEWRDLLVRIPEFCKNPCCPYGQLLSVAAPRSEALALGACEGAAADNGGAHRLRRGGGSLVHRGALRVAGSAAAVSSARDRRRGGSRVFAPSPGTR